MGNVGTLEGCKEACYVDNKCQHGLDWVRNDYKCYISTNSDIISGASGVDHYVYEGKNYIRNNFSSLNL